jgi:hypothetical protein
LEKLAIAFPPLPEQHRIVAEVERRLSVVLELEAVIAASLARAGRLRQAILKRAFEGKLAGQDPNDEPATDLLARIKVERAKREAEQRAAPRARKPKEKRMTRLEGQRRAIFEILSLSEDPLTPETVFGQTGLTIDQVEEFYQELRSEVGKRVQVLRPNKIKVYLEAIKP